FEEGMPATVTPSCARVSSVDQSSTTTLCGCTGTWVWPLEWTIVTVSAWATAAPPPRARARQTLDATAKRDRPDSMTTPFRDARGNSKVLSAHRETESS